jgi:hypothetical protein
VKNKLSSICSIFTYYENGINFISDIDEDPQTGKDPKIPKSTSFLPGRKRPRDLYSTTIYVSKVPKK